MKKIILTFSFAALGIMNNVYAQDFAQADTIDYIADKVQNWFIGGSFGMSYSMGENTRFDGFSSMTRPSFRFEIGKNLYPQFGMRTTFHYLNQRGRVEWEVSDYLDQYGQHEGNYSYSMMAGFLDGVFDFNNIIWGYDENRRFSIRGYVGLGCFYTCGWDQTQLAYLLNPTYKDCDVDGVHYNAGEAMDQITFGTEIDSENKFYFAGHVGLLANLQLNDAWSINLDVSFNGTDDGYNGSRFGRIYDSYFDVYAGLTYKLKDHGRRRLTYVHYTDEAYLNDLNSVFFSMDDSIAEAQKPIVLQQENVHYNEMLQTTVSFYIDKTFVTDAQKRNVASVANFLENHPDLDVVICGYADVQTAYPKYNMMLSKKRAQSVYDILTKEFDVDPNRLSMDYKGDQEQPFSIVNEWNRAVVFFIKPHSEDFKAGEQSSVKDIKLNSHEIERLNQTDKKATESEYKPVVKPVEFKSEYDPNANSSSSKPDANGNRIK